MINLSFINYPHSKISSEKTFLQYFPLIQKYLNPELIGNNRFPTICLVGYLYFVGLNRQPRNSFL